MQALAPLCLFLLSLPLADDVALTSVEEVAGPTEALAPPVATEESAAIASEMRSLPIRDDAPLVFTTTDSCPRIWGSAEAVVWIVASGTSEPPLAGTLPADTVLGTLVEGPIVLGNGSVETTVGGRLTLGKWFDKAPRIGTELSYLGMPRASYSNTVSDDGSLYLTVPIIKAVPGDEIPTWLLLTTAEPGDRGSATLENTIQFQGFEWNGLYAMNWLMIRELMAGPRFLHIGEDLTFTTYLQDDAPNFPGLFIQTLDQFDTNNYFYGAQIGARSRAERGWFYCSAAWKLAMGAMHSTVRIRGQSRTNVGGNFQPGNPITITTGGIFAQPTNIGNYEETRFAVIPELNTRIGVNVGEHLRIYLGTEMLLISSLLSPGDQMDPNINPSQLVYYNGTSTGIDGGLRRPAPTIDASPMFIFGFSLGMELYW